MPDIKSLLALTEASASMYVIYKDDQEKTLAQVTLNEVRAKGIDILTPAHILHVFVDSDDICILMDLKLALNSLFQQSASGHRHSLRLTINHCRALRFLRDVGRMKFVQKEDGRVVLVSQQAPADQGLYWTKQYVLMYMGEKDYRFPHIGLMTYMSSFTKEGNVVLIDG